MMEANELLSRPQISEPAPEPAPNPQVDLAKAALEVQSNSLVQEEFRNPSSTSIANQDISWYNQGVALIELVNMPKLCHVLTERSLRSLMMTKW